MKLQNLMNDISKFSAKTFGEGQRNPAILYHLEEEVGELVEAIKDYQSGNSCRDLAKSDELQRKMMMEYADCFMLLFDSADNAGLSANAILRAVRDKLEINKRRVWGKPEANGVCHHIKDNE